MAVSAKRLYFVLLGMALASLVLLLAAAYGVDAMLEHKAAAVREARLDNMVLEEEQRRLTKAKADIKKYEYLADIAKHIVPQDKDQAQTVREIVLIAERHNIKLGSVTFPVSSLGEANVEYSQLSEVKDIPDVLSLEITVQSDAREPATYKDFLDFLDALENNRRTALVTSISLLPDTEDANLLDFSLTLREYIKP